ncbi:MAG: sulfotransferase [Phormidium sp.]
MIANQLGKFNDREKRLIFVVGNSRSGTTMMGRILGKHPEVFTFHELHFFEQLWMPDDEGKSLEKPEAEKLVTKLLCIQRDGYLSQGDSHRFAEEAKELLAEIQGKALTKAEIFELFLHYEAVKNGKAIPCDQTPRNVFYIGEILKLYPSARIINLIRDPRDVLLSQKGKWKRRFLGAKNIPLTEAIRSRLNYHPITISKLWNSCIRTANLFVNNERVYSLRFEDIVNAPAENVQKICEFIGISFDIGLLEIPQIGSSSGVDRPEQKGIDRERAGSWQKGGLSKTEIFLCQWVTRDTMKNNGYSSLPISPNPWLLIYSIVSLPVQLVLVFLLNLKRMRNITETIRRRLV